MARIAVFVDAGYLFAQGSTAIAGSKQVRTNTSLDAPAAINAIHAAIQEKLEQYSLLRIYWYDGAVRNIGPSLEQEEIARLDNVKLRLGFVNSHGQQKGVDSLIVTDLIDLARNQAITDAMLLSGDEDVRVGVQIAQSLGVRVHLLGIHPSRGSQSKQLIFEADTVTEWMPETVKQFLKVNSSSVLVPELAKSPQDSAKVIEGLERLEIIKHTVEDFIGKLDSTKKQSLLNHWEVDPGIPPEFDKALLYQCKIALDDQLIGAEKKEMRKLFKNSLSSK